MLVLRSCGSAERFADRGAEERVTIKNRVITRAILPADLSIFMRLFTLTAHDVSSADMPMRLCLLAEKKGGYGDLSRKSRRTDK